MHDICTLDNGCEKLYKNFRIYDRLFPLKKNEGKRNYFSQMYFHERNVFKTDGFSLIFFRYFARIYLSSYAVSSRTRVYTH
jgi:hypothetical protein